MQSCLCLNPQHLGTCWQLPFPRACSGVATFEAAETEQTISFPGGNPFKSQALVQACMHSH